MHVPDSLHWIFFPHLLQAEAEQILAFFLTLTSHSLSNLQCLPSSCCQPGPTEVSINGSFMPEEEENGGEGKVERGAAQRINYL